MAPITHDIQLRHRLSPATIKTLSSLPDPPDRRAVLETACQAAELRPFAIKQDERAFFRAINEATRIPYVVREPVAKPCHKALLLIQVDLLKDGWPNKLKGAARKELLKERGRMYAVVERVLRCAVDILAQRGGARGVVVALDVLRSVRAGVWEGGGLELVQVEGIGRMRMDRLVAAGVRTVRQLGNLEFYHIERLLSRNPPFGQTVLRQLAGFPLLRLEAHVVQEFNDDDRAERGVPPAGPPAASSWVAKFVLGYDNEHVPQWGKRTPWTTLVVEGEDGRLAWFWRGSVRRLEGDKELIVRLGGRRDERLRVVFACEDLVGASVQQELRLGQTEELSV